MKMADARDSRRGPPRGGQSAAGTGKGVRAADDQHGRGAVLQVRIEVRREVHIQGREGRVREFEPGPGRRGVLSRAE